MNVQLHLYRNGDRRVVYRPDLEGDWLPTYEEALDGQYYRGEECLIWPLPANITLGDVEALLGDKRVVEALETAVEEWDELDRVGLLWRVWCVVVAYLLDHGFPVNEIEPRPYKK